MPAMINRKSDPEAWLNARHQDITSTEVAALFGLSPYMTEFELFHRKREAAPVQFEDNDRMRWGRRLEDSIAAGAAEDNGWTIRARNIYQRDAEARIGSSFDYTIVSHPDGPGLLEVKNVDGLVFKQNWTVNDDGTIEAPEHIELQVQHQLEVADYEWAVIVALVGGNDIKILHRKREREIGQVIRARVRQFWDRVERNDPPAPDYMVDAEFIARTLRRNADSDKVIEANETLDELIARYMHVSKEAADLDRLKDSIKAEILMVIGDAGKILSSHGTVNCTTTKDSAGTLVTPDMVGTHIGARKGYRMFRVNAKKGGAA
jgi:putative phage-type endonuclease